MNRFPKLALAAVLAGFAGQPAFAQSASCESIAAAGSLSPEEQEALGRAAAAEVSSLRGSNTEAADALQNCVAAGPELLVAAFQAANGTAVGDVLPLDDPDADDQSDTVDTVPAGSSPSASNS